MKQPVLIKGTQNGIIIRMNPVCTYEVIVEALKTKLTQAQSFFRGARMTLTFEGKELSEEQYYELADLIEQESGISIIYLNTDGLQGNGYVPVPTVLQVISPKLVTRHERNAECETPLFCRGDVITGQTLEADSDLIVLGNVEYGARIIARGSVTVLGNLLGTVIAGAGGRPQTFICAYCLNPKRMQIGRVVAKKIIKQEMSDKIPRIAAVKEGQIQIYQLFAAKEEEQQYEESAVAAK